MRQREADTLVIGSGWAGTLVAGQLAARGQRVTIVERGADRPWKVQQETSQWEGTGPGTERNHVNDPSGLDWPWNYVYAVGGASNRWAGTSARFLPEDFEMRSRFGVMRDWPLGYDDLLPDYKVAEREMGISGPETELMPGGGYPMPAFPFSPQDEAVRAHLEPFIGLASARPTKPYRDSPACCGSARCQLCPVDSRASVYNRLGDVLESPQVELVPDTVAARLISDAAGKRIVAAECIGRDGERTRYTARRFVVAANGLESAGLLLRSGLGGGDTGKYLFDHRNAKLLMTTRKPVGVGYGHSLITGASYRYYTGRHRRERAAALVLPLNSGPPNTTMFGQVVDGLVAGRTGKRLRAELVATWQRSLSFDVYLDDMPDAGATIRLSRQKDAFGLPKNEVRYPQQTPYLDRAAAHLLEDVPRRLRSLGAHDAQFLFAPTGAHHLGALRMGADGEDGVLDPEMRHRRRENLNVAGGAVFPTYGPAHPTLTIGALAVRLGRRLASERA